jgi:maltooligosyltrehalose trehalohydrolase
VGNRAQGDRISHVAGMERAKIAAAVYLLSPFVPMLFQGEEWAASNPFQYFADHQDRELARLVSEGRKREFAAFGWAPETIPDPESPKTFGASKLNWRELSHGEHAAMLGWYRALIRLRRSAPCLNNANPGNVQVEFDDEKEWLRITRGTVSIFCNLGPGEIALPVPQSSTIELASYDSIRIAGNAIRLPGNSVAVLQSVPIKSA